MENILKHIQGKDELIYTQDEANLMTELIKRVKLLYPRNTIDEADQKKLVKNFEKLRKLITAYAESVDVAMLLKNVSQSEIEKLKRQFDTISQLEKESLSALENIELKYE